MVDYQAEAELTDTPETRLPEIAGQAAAEQPELWRAFQELGAQAGAAGPLDSRTRRLVHIAFAMAVGSEGATHSHVRRALSDGLARKDIEHLAWLAVTTLGWPQAIKGLAWIRDVTGAASGQNSARPAGRL